MAHHSTSAASTMNKDKQTNWLKFGRSVELKSTRLSSTSSTETLPTFPDRPRPLNSTRLLKNLTAYSKHDDQQALSSGSVASYAPSAVVLTDLVRSALPEDSAVIGVLAEHCPSAVVKITCLGFGVGFVCMLVVAALAAGVWFAVASRPGRASVFK
jgi:hypothetical protein